MVVNIFISFTSGSGMPGGNSRRKRQESPKPDHKYVQDDSEEEKAPRKTRGRLHTDSKTLLLH